MTGISVMCLVWCLFYGVFFPSIICEISVDKRHAVVSFAETSGPLLSMFCIRVSIIV